MKRFFGIILIFVAAASGALSQSRRVVRRADAPKEERTEKSDARDESKDKATADKQRADESAQIFTGKEVTVRAVVRSRPEPKMPAEARRAGIQGAVKLRIILGADGKVRDKIDVLEGLSYGLTEEAIKAARLIEFEPARKDGRPVSQYVTVIYNFRLH